MSGIKYENVGGAAIAEDGGALMLTTDAFLLEAFVKKNGKQSVCELCSGTGIVSAMLLSDKKAATCECVDFQEKLCELAKKNAENYGGKMTVVRSDVLDYRPARVFDAAVCNPPYYRRGSKPSQNRENDLCRRESTALIGDFAACASRALRDGGDAYFCYTPERLPELITACRENRLEPKVLVPVYPDRDRGCGLILLSAKKNASPGLIITRPLYLRDNGNITDEYEKITNNHTAEFLYE